MNILRYSYHGLRSAGRRIASSTESSTLAWARRARVRCAGTPWFSVMRATNGSISAPGSRAVELAAGLDPQTSKAASAMATGAWPPLFTSCSDGRREQPGEDIGIQLHHRTRTTFRGISRYRLQDERCLLELTVWRTISGHTSPIRPFIAVSVLRGSASEKHAVSMNGHDNPEPRHESHHGGTTVAHERKREPHHRQDTRHHADVHEHIDEER